jgi:hypothetical protein
MTISSRDCFFTSIAVNYLPKALALTESVFKVYPDARMVIAVIDYRWLSTRQVEVLAAIVQRFTMKGARLEFTDPLVLYARPDLFRYKFTVIEACTAIKPAVAMMLLESADPVTYLDPDTFMYSPLPAHPDASDRWDFQLTPHVLAPAGADSVISERMFMLHGTFNLGYFAVRRTSQALRFLGWWKQFCVDFGADAVQAGLFVDQKPVDLLPSFIDSFSVLRHSGCNIAWWNIFCDGRQLDADGRTVTFDERHEALVFFHFSNLDREPDPQKRLVAKPLKSFASDRPRSRRMADLPALEKLYADYEKRVAAWAPFVAETKVADGLASQKHDAPQIARLLLSEALRRGMSYEENPFEQSTLRVVWQSLSYVLSKLEARDVLKVLSNIFNAMRLGLSSRVLRTTN